MDFAFSEEQEAVRALAAQIFAGHASTARVKDVEAGDERFDRAVWAELAGANLLGIALPDEVGGSGFGVIELCLLLEQQGRTVSPVPLWPTLVLGALPIAEFGSADQRERWLPGVVAGDVVLTAALESFGPELTARADGAAWRLDGTRLSVPAAQSAARVIVPARTDAGVRAFLVDPNGDGVEHQRAETTNRELRSHLVLSGAPAEPLGGAGVVEWLLDRALVGLCALQVGVCEEALRLAAAYTSERVQFGRPLSTFQGVALKAADAYIDTEAMRATLWQAAWRLTEGLDAAQEVAVAKWWAADGGQRVVHATQHLHGGMGADVDYPVHRYFLWGKQLSEELGGASAQLARLGAAIASRPIEGVRP
ncbi:MAG: acyl-CoA dehydrogenase [Actinobacteria bacterium]|nr:MAG: acyl-CoA dehydrogenase [Actinomycetota bacterium]